MVLGGCMADTLIIEHSVTYEEKIKKSQFICTLQPVSSIQEAKNAIAQVASKNANATHNCWAYIIGNSAETFHFSDAGEPAGTAGKPIYQALSSANITNVAAVVTRYFGGVKLGVRGLIDAYGGVTSTAISSAILLPNVHYYETEIVLDYTFFDTLTHRLKKLDTIQKNIIYTDKIQILFSTHEKDFEELSHILSNYALEGKLQIKKPKL